jgi:hypothetical protein
MRKLCLEELEGRVTPSAPSIVSTSVAVNQVGLNFNVPAPSRIHAGDLLLAIEEVNHLGGSGVQAPTGWTRVNSVGFNAGNEILVAFEKIAANNDVVQRYYAFHGTGQCVSNVEILNISGDAAAGVEGSTRGSGGGTTLTAPSYTPQKSNELVICAFAGAGTNYAIKPAANLTDDGTITSNAGTLDLAYSKQIAPVATGTESAQMAKAHQWGALLFAIPST